MSGGLAITNTLLSLLPGTIVRGILALPTAGVCQVPRNILFKKARSFIEATEQNKGAFQDLIARLRIGGRQSLLLITGHTDSNGSKELNQALSDRRTRAVRAVLKDDTGEWERLFLIDEGWGTPELTSMSVELGEANDLSLFFGSSADAITKRRGLFSRYFARLLSGSAVPPITPATPDMLGFGKEQPLHGDPNNPSRDVTQPPILGDHEPSRRSEFFFFAPGRAVVRGEYPTWVGECALTPPAAPITVTIAPFETVRRNQTIDVQITVTPAAPLRAGSNVTLKLSTTSGTGAARFVDTGTDTMTIRASQTVKVLGVTSSSALDNVRLTATVVGQPGTGAQEDFTVVDNIFIHLQFEVFKLTAPSGFVPLPAGVTIDIMNDGALGASTITGKNTDANGRVVFNLPDLSASGTPNPDIFFQARTNGLNHAGHRVPKDWSTKGWLAADNTTPGLQTGFIGPAIGTPAAPVVFRVGLDFHARLTYQVDAGARAGKEDPAPPGVLVKLMQEETGPDRVLLTLRTGRNGLIDGVSFDAEAGRTFYLHVDFEIEDSAINFKSARFCTVAFVPPIIDVLTAAGPTMTWDSNESDANKKDFKNHRSTSIVAVAALDAFKATIKDRNVALYILKTLRELGLFLFKITRSDWKGIEVAVTPTAPIRAFSFPINRIQLSFPDDRWSRETVTHEMGHQVMWEALDFLSVGIFYEGALGQLQLNHQENLMANEEQALIEGWAEFVESIFQSTATPRNAPFPSTPPYSVTSLVEPPLIPFTTPPAVAGGLGPPPLNRGELVEGALANGLWAIFNNHVAALPAAALALVPETEDGDVAVTAPWIETPAIQSRFLSDIWEPLKVLRPLSNPNSTLLFASIRAKNTKSLGTAANPETWHLLMPELQAFNMARRAPTATRIEPHWGPVAGGPSIGLKVTITGTDFVEKTTARMGGPAPLVLETTVSFDAVPGTGVTVGQHTSLEVVPPPLPALLLSGTVDVTVNTPGGTSNPLKFLYIDDPLKVDSVTAAGAAGALVPVVVSTRGDDSFEIGGQGFLPGAIVEISGATVSQIDVKIVEPNRIRVERTPVRAPGVADVVVRNPDNASSVLPASLRFADPPTVINMTTPASRSGPANQSNDIIIEGLNIAPNATMTEGTQSLPITITAIGGTTQVEFALPPGAPGVVILELQNPNDGLSTTFDFFREDVP